MKKLNGDKVFTIFNYILASAFLLIAIYPLYYVVICSFSGINAITTGKVRFWPADVTLVGYKKMLEQAEIWAGYKWTIIYTVVGTGIQLLFTIPAAYALSRPSLPFRTAINFYFLVTMFIGGGLIPTYLLMDRLHLTDTFILMVLMGAVSVWNMIICRTFFSSSIPVELLDAAKIDGGSEIKIFLRVVLPLSKSILAVMTLYFAVGHWNSYFTALIYLRDKARYPLQLVLRSMLLSTSLMTEMANEGGTFQQNLMDLQNLKYCTVIAASLPVLVIYPFIQKYFVKGVMIGAVKG